MKYDSIFDSEENKTLITICARKLISNIAIGSIIWGAINILIGIAAMKDTVINVVILILGIMMLGTGIRAIKHPSIGSILTQTIVMLLLFFWNLFVTVINALAGEKFEPQGVIFAFVIAIIFALNYARLRRFRNAIESINKDKLKSFSEICKTILKKKPKNDPLLAQTADSKTYLQCMGDKAFFIQKDMMRAFVCDKDKVKKAVLKPESKKWNLLFNHPLGRLKYNFNADNTSKIVSWLGQ